MTNQLGALIIDLQGTDITEEECDILKHPLVGGVILFKQNYKSREQLIHLCQSMRSSLKKSLLIMVDQEGGRVQRFIQDFTQLPFMSEFGTLYEADPNFACRMASDCGWLMAIELLSAGIDLSLAPVLDLNKGISSIIGKRAFHSHPQIVIQIASAYINGMREAGMAATGKHFPGHGSVRLDSHIAMPVDERMLWDIERSDMIPFMEMIKSGISGIMAAHIIFPNVDPYPVGFSKYWLKDILRHGLGFTGTIFSDDLNMEGANISANFTDRVVAAREAGCDFALLCNNRKGVIQVLDNLPFEKHLLEENKWANLKGNREWLCKPYQENKRWLDTHEFLKKLESVR